LATGLTPGRLFQIATSRLWLGPIRSANSSSLANTPAPVSRGRVTLFDGGQISGSTEMPECVVKLGDCGRGVLAWQSKTVWLVEPSGRVQLVAETDRPIRGVWGHDSGFYALAGELASFRVRPTETGRRI
jgi:hypothetical protein